MKIQIFDNGGTTTDRYTVAINTSVYTLSMDASVNNYAGELGREISESMLEKSGKKIAIFTLPLETLKAIARRIELV